MTTKTEQLLRKMIKEELIKINKNSSFKGINESMATEYQNLFAVLVSLVKWFREDDENLDIDDILAKIIHKIELTAPKIDSASRLPGSERHF